MKQRHKELFPGLDIGARLYVKQTSDKDLLHSAGNSTQYPVTAAREQNLNKNGRMCIYN